jgi:dihydroorotate dehydrogenase (NAD+) catalytic subunit
LALGSERPRNDIHCLLDREIVNCPDIDLRVRLGRLELANPIMVASGTFGYAREMAGLIDLKRLGAILPKTITAHPRPGNKPWRTVETPSGMLNSIGLQGPGIESFIENDLAWLHSHGVRTVVSIAGGRMEEFVTLARALYGHPAVSAIEVNISCPNVESRGQVFACDAGDSSRVISAVRRAADPAIPIFAKLTPDVTDITAIARACQESGADGVSLINTLLGIVIDTDTLGPVLGGVTGGLSGPAITPVAVRCVWQVHQALPSLPILGMGGIRTGLDALQFILAGASAVSVGTAVFGDPSAPIRIQAELSDALQARGFTSLRDAIGLAHKPREQRRPTRAVAAR